MAAWDGPGRWWTILPASLIIYAGLVTHQFQRANIAADRRGCIDVHGLQYTALVFAGMLAGLALGPWLIRWARRGVRAFMPELTEDGALRRIRSTAVGFILLGMLLDIGWIVPSFNLFIDLHRILTVEVEIILYAMGIGAGAAWYAILDRQGWLGLLITPLMALMLLGSSLARHGWC